MDLHDTLDQIGAVHRALTSREHLGRPARVLTAEQTYPASAEEVWAALTDPARLPRWFSAVEGDLRLGGRFQVVGNAGGTVERCQAPSTLAVTWEYGDAVSWLELDLTEHDGRTTLVLRHIAHENDFAAHYGPGAVGIGWDLALMGLSTHLAGGPDVDPEQAATWHTTERGRAFILRSSDAWRDADAADGTDPDDARVRADRTAAFYLGEEEPEGTQASTQASTPPSTPSDEPA